MRTPDRQAKEDFALYSCNNATEKGIVMNDEVRDDSGPLRHFRIGRRAVLQTLATGVGAAVVAIPAAAAGHAHHAAATAPADAATATATATGASPRVFLDEHTFDTLGTLSEQIVPGSRAAKVPEFLDRLLAVESTDTQKRFTQSLGAFEREARAAHGKPWKALTAEQATALLTKISTQDASDASRSAFDALKRAIADGYYSTEAGMLELGWDRNVAYAPPSTCS
jgi:Gluconate 2-dehydrogenase subunit 3